MSKPSAAAFSRRGPDIVTEEIVAVLSKKLSFEFKPLFDIVHGNLRASNKANGGEEMLRLRVYEKLQSLVNQGVVKKTINADGKHYKGIAGPLLAFSEEMKLLRAASVKRVEATAAAV